MVSDAALQAGGARTRIDAALAAIDRANPLVNAFTSITADRARNAADALDARRAAAAARGEPEFDAFGKPRDPAPGALAGVPYAVKNLFDVAGLVTLAGAKINRELPPAGRDATVVRRLDAAGAILLGALNMDEYAFGFTTENTHFGPTRNPHDLTRIAGGSSGGSAVAVAAGLVDVALGSDTNGSIRVPASFCGVFGLKPTFGRLSRAGTYPFVSSLDHVGPLARSVALLAAAYDAMQGPDRSDPACARRGAEPVGAMLDDGLRGLRIARLGGYFERNAGEETRAAVDAVANALGASATVEWPEVDRARAAAATITSSESSNLHLARLRARPQDFEPLTRDRFLAGALIPSDWVVHAQRLRRWFRDRVLRGFGHHDVLIAGATPWPAPPIGAERTTLNGAEVLMRPSCGLLTQPVSFVGLPALVVPVGREGTLPVGVQLIAAPWREDLLVRTAAWLEAAGVARMGIATV